MKKFAWVVLLIALGVYFLQDEALTPLAERALNYQPAPVPAEQNAFVGIAGFNALAGRDFLQMGGAYIRNAHLGQANQQDEQNFDYREKEYSYSCAKELTENCLNEIRADAKNIQKLQEAEQELIQRYLKIQEMPEYSNPIFPPSVYAVGNMVLPRFDYLTYISRILSAQAILDIKNGRVSKGLNWFQKDMAFYRRVFAAKDADLIEKMIALVQLRNHAMLLSLLIEEGGLRALLAPLDAPKENMLNASWREHATLLRAFYKTPLEALSVQDPQSQKADFSTKFSAYFLYELLYKRNMTANFSAELLGNRQNILNKTPIALLSSEDISRKTLEQTGCTGIRMTLMNCKRLSNFIGEGLMLIDNGADAPAHYLLRAYDTDALLRLVRARLEYQLAAKDSRADPLKILAALPPETFNPYTEKPFDFDAKRGALVFQPAAKRDKDKRVEIRLFNPPQP
ncbi:hypothetical protein AGMMS49545_11300 [Betaproteobacteria bacterium]|nr:hypothetical protein AGMMS49545_11300 [Betaproteobacteria bacterium]GHU44509.1 hypothetical protein AGMMS50289_12970 [Betaproteobacteria bacterium]